MATLEKRRVSDLDCHIITSDHAPRFTVILCHGFGAPGDDLVPIGAQLLRDFPELLDQVQFVFPTAPLSLDHHGIPGGRAWWPLDLDRLTKRNVDSLSKEVPPELQSARQKILALIKALQQSSEPSPGGLVLGGFSQGAMLAVDVSLRMEQPPTGLVIWSGAQINAEDWTERASRLAQTQIIQSHGREDDILPYDSAIALKEMLVSQGNQVNFIGFRGPHSIPREPIQALGLLLQRLLGIIE